MPIGKIEEFISYLNQKFYWIQVERHETDSDASVRLEWPNRGSGAIDSVVSVYIGQDKDLEWIVEVSFNPDEDISKFGFHSDEIESFYRILEELKES